MPIRTTSVNLAQSNARLVQIQRPASHVIQLVHIPNSITTGATQLVPTASILLHSNANLAIQPARLVVGVQRLAHHAIQLVAIPISLLIPASLNAQLDMLA
jgi:hypothetical protein